MEYPFVYIPGLHSTSFSMYCLTRGMQEWGKCLNLQMWVVEYHTSENTFVTGTLKAICSDSWNWRKFVMVIFASKCSFARNIVWGL